MTQEPWLEHDLNKTFTIYDSLSSIYRSKCKRLFSSTLYDQPCAHNNIHRPHASTTTAAQTHVPLAQLIPSESIEARH